MKFKPKTSRRHIRRLLPCGEVIEATRTISSCFWRVHIYRDESQWGRGSQWADTEFQLEISKKGFLHIQNFLQALWEKTPDKARGAQFPDC